MNIKCTNYISLANRSSKHTYTKRELAGIKVSPKRAPQESRKQNWFSFLPFTPQPSCLHRIKRDYVFFFFLRFFFLIIYFLYSRFLLVIYFIHISVDMSIPISQFIPSPLIPVTVSLFSTSVTLLLFCK